MLWLRLIQSISLPLSKQGRIQGGKGGSYPPPLNGPYQRFFLPPNSLFPKSGITPSLWRKKNILNFFIGMSLLIVMLYIWEKLKTKKNHFKITKYFFLGDKFKVFQNYKTFRLLKFSLTFNFKTFHLNVDLNSKLNSLTKMYT